MRWQGNGLARESAGEGNKLVVTSVFSCPIILLPDHFFPNHSPAQSSSLDPIASRSSHSSSSGSTGTLYSSLSQRRRSICRQRAEQNGSARDCSLSNSRSQIGQVKRGIAARTSSGKVDQSQRRQTDRAIYASTQLFVELEFELLEPELDDSDLDFVSLASLPPEVPSEPDLLSAAAAFLYDSLR